MKTLILTLTAAIGLASTSMAPASPAYLVQDTELMSGPDQGYPLVDNLPSGDEVDVQGCTDGYYWCDVIDNGERGWVPGNALEFDDGQDEQPVALPDMGYSYGIPIVVFSIQPYWNAYYSDYPFFVQRWSWYYWAPPYRSGPPMPPPHVVPLPHPIPDPPPPRVVHLPTPIFNPPPRVVPLPHPIPDPPPPRVVHLPTPIFNPPPRVVPLPHPIPDPPPPRVVHLPTPIFNPPPRDVPPPQPIFNNPPRVVRMPQPIPGQRMRVASVQRPSAPPRAPRPAAPRGGGGSHHRH